jgi:hypothetical protein
MNANILIKAHCQEKKKPRAKFVFGILLFDN